MQHRRHVGVPDKGAFFYVFLFDDNEAHERSVIGCSLSFGVLSYRAFI